VANDTGGLLDVESMGHPWVKVVNTSGGKGPAVARNTAIAAAKAPLILPLDADDMAYPNTCRMYYEAWVKYPDSLVYADCDIEDALDMPRRYYHSGPWKLDKILKTAIYQTTILYPKAWWDAVGGYDSGIEWEDWLFGVKLHLMGIGATQIEKPWGVYRQWCALDTGQSKSDGDNADYDGESFKEKVAHAQQWIEWKEGQMACAGCKKKAGTQVYDAEMQAMIDAGPNRLFVYVGPRNGQFTANSRVPGHGKYWIKRGEIFEVTPRDAVEIFAGMAHAGFREVIPEQVAPAELPTEPPRVPVLEVPGEITEPEVDSAPSLNGLGILDGVVSEAVIEKLKGARFDSIFSLKANIIARGGAGILEIPGIGNKTLSKIKEVVLSD
jgi:hypothetical protein